jgi:tripartite-type tricarboxylate transporter receptor subunit TctC
MAEQGFKDFQMYGWAMLYAPSGTPRPIVEKLHEEIGKALTDPAVKKLRNRRRCRSCSFTITFTRRSNSTARSCAPAT